MFRKKQGIAEGWASRRSPVGRKTRRAAGVTIQFQAGRAGFEPRPTANHAAKPHANRALGSQGRAGEATHTERLKTGASELKTASHTCSAPSFSPYRSNGLHRADTPTRRHASEPYSPLLTQLGRNFSQEPRRALEPLVEIAVWPYSRV